jgi:hypothetical protein
VYARGGGSEAPDSPQHERARKIRPELTRGEPVRVAGGRNQAEAELIQNLLLEEGIPSMIRRSAGFDVPDFLAGGPRDVLVPESGAEEARALLATTELEPSPAPDADAGPSSRHVASVLAAILGGGLLAALIAWLLLGSAG